MKSSQGIRRHIKWNSTLELGIVRGGGGPRIRNRGGVFGLYLPVKRTPGKGLLLIIPVPSLDVHVCSRAVCLSK